jgi:hypothetical protein
VGAEDWWRAGVRDAALGGTSPDTGPQALAVALCHLTVKWSETGCWPIETRAYLARSIGAPITEQALHNALHEMRNGLRTRRPMFSSWALPEFADMIEAKLQEELCAQEWCTRFIQAYFPGVDLHQYGLLDAFDPGAIDASAYARTTYLAGDSREVAADEVVLQTSLDFRLADTVGSGRIKLQALSRLPECVRGMVRQTLARLRADALQAKMDFDGAVQAQYELLRLPPVVRTMNALRAEMTHAERTQSQDFLRTQSGHSLVAMLPMAKWLPNGVAAQVNHLSGACSRLESVQYVANSCEPLAASLSRLAQTSAMRDIRHSAWDAVCRLLFFPEAAGSVLIGDSSLHTPPAVLLQHTGVDQLHGCIAGFALARLAGNLEPRKAAVITHTWCTAWSDLLTVVGAGPGMNQTCEAARSNQ